MVQTKLFVGNLPDTADDASLAALFTGIAGFVSARIIRDNYSGRSRGFGFVMMSDSGTAGAAVRTLQGKDYGGRKLVLNIAREPYQP